MRHFVSLGFPAGSSAYVDVPSQNMASGKALKNLKGCNTACNSQQV
jgi:hypothetical protein